MDRNYEQEYKKAFEAAKGLHEAGNALTKKQMEIVFPELAESEDERIRKRIRLCLDECVHSDIIRDYERDECLAFLEKQKEPENTSASTMAPSCWEVEQKEPHYTKRNALFDKCVENCAPKTVEEVNKRIDDIVNMSELSAFEQALTNFIGYWEDDEEKWPSKFVKKHGKHILDMAREELKKEQNPIQTDAEKEYVRTLKSLVSDFVRANNYIERGYYQQIYDWLDGRHIEQKPVDFPTTDEEVNEFLETHSKVEVPEKYKTPDFVFSKQEYKSYPIISKDTTSVKPAEWSEEDEMYLSQAIETLEHENYSILADKLKSIRNRVGKEFLQPHWKPSEEQMKALEHFIRSWGESGTMSPQNTILCAANSLLTDLQKLL